MNVRKKLVAALAACAAAFWISTAPATTLTITGWVGGNFHQGVDVTAPSYNGQAGGFVGTYGLTPIQVWCYELGQTFSFGVGYNDYTIGTPANEALLSALFQEAYGLATTSAFYSAAFQLAVWEILYDGDLSLYSGTFHTNRVANATDQQAEAWLAGLGGFSDLGDIILFQSREHQDFIGRRPPGNLPEPAPLALIGAGLVALILASRRKADRAAGA
jgi:hypothetical protein